MKINNLHPLQSPKWGEFREKTGIKVVNHKGLQITIHPIPYTKSSIGYFPKGLDINQNMLNELLEIGKKENCIFIQIEPNVEKIMLQMDINLKTYILLLILFLQNIILF